ncbi:hypothetical protein [Streptomyces sp. NBC_01750]|uniref:hypothetical protein n=1 Tax=Streptomyces sp. NBC_01750 TaxID=2975928 RepID=UPI002DD9CFDC|nr:hypothetical protein [Streptomyces sp. NBC_01750]WSD30663.1 hypothetical protein OG966_00905 [Streptomyces sp. NBC_01750]
MRQATILTDSVADGLQDRPRLDAALRQYDLDRDKLVMDGHRTPWPWQSSGRIAVWH